MSNSSNLLQTKPINMIPGIEFLWIGFVILGFAVQIWIIRAAVRADEVVRNQKTMIWFLMKMSEKAGVDPSEMEESLRTFKIK